MMFGAKWFRKTISENPPKEENLNQTLRKPDRVSNVSTLWFGNSCPWVPFFFYGNSFWLGVKYLQCTPLFINGRAYACNVIEIDLCLVHLALFMCHHFCNLWYYS